MDFESFEQCLKEIEIVLKRSSDGSCDYDEFCEFFDKVVSSFPNRKKYLLDLFSDFENAKVDNESGLIAVANSIVAVDQNINDLPLLLSYFDDSKEPEWAFESLMSTVAQYPNPQYTETLMDNFNVMLPHAIDWASYLLGRILNGGQESCDIVWNHLHKCPEEPLRNILEYMLKDEGWNHQHKYIRALLGGLDSGPT
jgi:hypothetical protein